MDVRKIVSLVPTNSEMVCLLDCTRLKGGTRYDRFPEELARRVREKKIVIIGGGYDPNLERIIEIGPDLVLANGPSQEQVVSRLKRMGYPVLSLWPDDIEGIKRDFSLLGQILDRRAKAERIMEEIETRLKILGKRVKDKKRKKVYIQTWPDPMITVGRDSFPQTLLSLAGGTNIFSDMPFDSGKISMEWVIQRNPEVLIFIKEQKESVKKILKLPGWRLVDGVKKRHICFISEIDLRPTIQFLEGVEEIHECLFAGNPS
ncbi:MAG: ABC transporter substrate-binding protein [Candidatus Binatia bacterium]